MGEACDHERLWTEPIKISFDLNLADFRFKCISGQISTQLPVFHLRGHKPAPKAPWTSAAASRRVRQQTPSELITRTRHQSHFSVSSFLNMKVEVINARTHQRRRHHGAISTKVHGLYSFSWPAGGDFCGFRKSGCADGKMDVWLPQTRSWWVSGLKNPFEVSLK